MSTRLSSRPLKLLLPSSRSPCQIRRRRFRGSFCRWPQGQLSCWLSRWQACTCSGHMPTQLLLSSRLTRILHYRLRRMPRRLLRRRKSRRRRLPLLVPATCTQVMPRHRLRPRGNRLHRRSQRRLPQRWHPPELDRPPDRWQRHLPELGPPPDLRPQQLRCRLPELWWYLQELQSRPPELSRYPQERQRPTDLRGQLHEGLRPSDLRAQLHGRLPPSELRRQLPALLLPPTPPLRPTSMKRSPIFRIVSVKASAGTSGWPCG
jgi:hypothetical protein